MTRILVTGATGLVGNALCPYLRAAGHEVSAAVRDLGGDRIPAGVTPFLVPDIGPDTDWAGALEGIDGVGGGIDSIVHLAARVHIMRDSSPDPDAAFMTINAGGTQALAVAAAGAGVKRFVYLSTVKVMGDHSENPFRETDTPRPEDAYSRSKLAGEEALLAVAGKAGLEPVILRPPLVYGPGVKGNMLSLMKICQMAPPLPFAAVNNRRSLINVNNLADAIIAALTLDEAVGEVFFVRDDEDVSTPGLLRLIARSMDRPVRLFPLPAALLRLSGAMSGKTAMMARVLGNLQVDDEKIRRQLGWKPPIGMVQGMQEMADWFSSGKPV